MTGLKTIVRESEKVTGKIIDIFLESNGEKVVNFQDAVIIGLIEDMIAKINAFIILQNEGNVDTVDMIMRSVLESHVYLTYILKADTEDRAKAYFYSSKIEDIKIIDKLIENSKVGRDMRKILGKNKKDIEGYNPIVFEAEYRKELEQNYMGALRTSDKKRKWYDFDNRTKTFEQLCAKVGMVTEYELIYRFFSKEVHSTRVISRLKFKKTGIKIGYTDKNTLLHTLLGGRFLIYSVRNILDYYKLKDFKKHFNVMVTINPKI